MSQPTYAYDPHSLDYVAQCLHTTNADIQNKLITLQTEAEKNLALWTDDAQYQYGIRKGQWDQTMSQMNDILGEKTAPALMAMHERMNMTEKANMKMWM